MKRMRAVLVILTLLASLQFLTACYTFRGPASDAKDGAGIGFALGGPQGAAIVSAIWVGIGLLARHVEKRIMRRRGILTDKHQKSALVPKSNKPHQLIIDED